MTWHLCTVIESSAAYQAPRPGHGCRIIKACQKPPERSFTNHIYSVHVRRFVYASSIKRFPARGLSYISPSLDNCSLSIPHMPTLSIPFSDIGFLSHRARRILVFLLFARVKIRHTVELAQNFYLYIYMYNSDSSSASFIARMDTADHQSGPRSYGINTLSLPPSTIPQAGRGQDAHDDNFTPWAKEQAADHRHTASYNRFQSSRFNNHSDPCWPTSSAPQARWRVSPWFNTLCIVIPACMTIITMRRAVRTIERSRQATANKELLLNAITAQGKYLSMRKVDNERICQSALNDNTCRATYEYQIRLITVDRGNQTPSTTAERVISLCTKPVFPQRGALIRNSRDTPFRVYGTQANRNRQVPTAIVISFSLSLLYDHEIIQLVYLLFQANI